MYHVWIRIPYFQFSGYIVCRLQVNRKHINLEYIRRYCKQVYIMFFWVYLLMYYTFVCLFNFKCYLWFSMKIKTHFYSNLVSVYCTRRHVYVHIVPILRVMYLLCHRTLLFVYRQLLCTQYVQLDVYITRIMVIIFACSQFNNNN